MSQFYGNYLGDCYASEQLTVTTAAVSTPTSATIYPVATGTAYVKNGPSAALITVGTDKVRVTMDGATNPSATLGHEIAVGGSLTVVGSQNVKNLRFFGSGAASSKVDISYYGLHAENQG